MTITCPHCGMVAAALEIGRPRSTISVTDICDVLQSHYSRLRGQHTGRVKHLSVLGAAEELGCSPALVYKVLKVNGKTVDQVLEGVK